MLNCVTSQLKTYFMKTTLLSLLAIAGFSAVFTTQTFAQKDLEAAELRFARMAKETNVREAFLQNFADEGIILLPAPSSAKKFYGEQEPNKVVLEWKPAFVLLAGSGDFGYTTGPAQAKGSPESNEYFYYGQFISVWEKGINGWKVIFDTGIPHEGPHQAWDNKEAQLQVLRQTVVTVTLGEFPDEQAERAYRGWVRAGRPRPRREGRPAGAARPNGPAPEAGSDPIRQGPNGQRPVQDGSRQAHRDNGRGRQVPQDRSGTGKGGGDRVTRHSPGRTDTGS